uniref:(California timema) hypothetical protein n=1 Tax=Timema californicum TaxID=61474 RepID=A0A7R9PDA2_TIMCA|nr:unnamed protein product [Timema californicum]
MVSEPPWLHAIAEGTGADFIHSSKDGRTYLASRYLNDGKGAFSYMAISVADQEPLFVPLSEGINIVRSKKTDEFIEVQSTASGDPPMASLIREGARTFPDDHLV